MRWSQAAWGTWIQIPQCLRSYRSCGEWAHLFPLLRSLHLPGGCPAEWLGHTGLRATSEPPYAGQCTPSLLVMDNFPKWPLFPCPCPPQGLPPAQGNPVFPLREDGVITSSSTCLGFPQKNEETRIMEKTNRPDTKLVFGKLSWTCQPTQSHRRPRMHWPSPAWPKSVLLMHSGAHAALTGVFDMQSGLWGFLTRHPAM